MKRSAIEKKMDRCRAIIDRPTYLSASARW